MKPNPSARPAARSLAAALLAALLATGCAASPEGPAQAWDPLEGANRNVYAFNETVDEYVLAPAARGWVAVTTPGVRNRVGNFFDNLAQPGVVVNDLLQGNLAHALRGSWRFVFNTTIGIGGLFDPASNIGAPPRNEDFGQTLGAWGAEPGAFLMLPVLGPSSARDVTRYPVDYYTNVLTYIALNTATAGGLLAVQIVNTRAQLDRAVKIREQAALDPYAFTRSSYSQYRYKQVWNGDPPQTDDPFDSFFEEMESEDEGAPGGE